MLSEGLGYENVRIIGAASVAGKQGECLGVHSISLKLQTK